VTDPERPRTTPEGHTPEEPRPDELGKKGSPGAGMTEEVPHAADARAVEAGGAPAAGEPIGDAHGADAPVDDHAHVEPRLGPIDWPAWTYALVGAVLGLLVIATFYIAIS
jgi:sugar phosphate isomerase/epimerase